MQYLEVSFTLEKQVVNDVSGNFAKSILTMVNLQSPVYAVVKIQFCLHSLWTSASFVIPLDSRAVVKSAETKKRRRNLLDKPACISGPVVYGALAWRERY